MADLRASAIAQDYAHNVMCRLRLSSPEESLLFEVVRTPVSGLKTDEQLSHRIGVFGFGSNMERRLALFVAKCPMAYVLAVEKSFDPLAIVATRRHMQCRFTTASNDCWIRPVFVEELDDSLEATWTIITGFCLA